MLYLGRAANKADTTRGPYAKTIVEERAYNGGAGRNSNKRQQAPAR